MVAIYYMIMNYSVRNMAYTILETARTHILSILHNAIHRVIAYSTITTKHIIQIWTLTRHLLSHNPLNYAFLVIDTWPN